MTWTDAPLESAGDWLSGGTPSKQNLEFWIGSIPWVSPKDMKRSRISDAIDHVSETAVGSGTQFAPPGSLLMVVRGMILAHTFPVALTTAPVTFNQDIKALVPAPGWSAEFLLYWLQNRAPEVLRLVDVANHGTKRLPSERLFALTLSRPPLGEQRKIAAILSSVDDAIDAAQAVIEQLQVVKKAMMAELLTRGLPGRHTRFKQTEIGEVPATWEVLPLESIADGPANGRSPPSKARPPGVPTFSIAAIRDGRVNIADNLKYAEVEPSGVANFVLATGDVLIVRGNGNPDLVGKCGVVEDVPNGCIYPDILMRVRPRPSVSVDYFVTAWNSDVVHDQVLDRAKTTNGTYKINGHDVRSIVLPIPPRGEQDAIGGTLGSIESARRENERELAGLRATKAALMSVLLTGEVRVTIEDAAA